jgi:hypothetical protein
VFRVQLYFPFENIENLLAGMTHQCPELLQAVGLHTGQQRHHPLVRDVAAQCLVDVVVGLVGLAFPFARDGPARSVLRGVGRRQQFRNIDAQPIGNPEDCLERRRQLAVLYLG